MPKPLTRIFAQRVREAALAKGYSINRLADFAGLSRGFVSEMLREQKVPSLDTVERIAAALDVEPWRLLRDERPPGTKTGG